MESQPISAPEHKAILSLCILAAFADGTQSDAERARIQQILNGFSAEQLDLASIYQDVLDGKTRLADAAAQLQSAAARALAYEMAVCVSQADGQLSDSEQTFLDQLRQALHLDPAIAADHHQAAEAIVAQPLPPAAPPPMDSNREAEIDRMILNAAILNGALEIMPHSLATMAIIPLQMRLVYQIGSRYGYELDRGHIKDFLATVGVGLSSQVLEGFTRRLFGGLAGQLAGGFLGSLAGQAVGSAFAFATTYALGQVARKYYASGRTLSTDQLKDVFSEMLQQGRSMQSRYSGDIAARSRQVNIADLAPLIRQT